MADGEETPRIVVTSLKYKGWGEKGLKGLFFLILKIFFFLRMFFSVQIWDAKFSPGNHKALKETHKNKKSALVEAWTANVYSGG